MLRTVLITRRQAGFCLFGMVFFGLLVRLFIGMSYQNPFDTEWYLMWAKDIQQGFFNAYDGHVRQLDYPPVYLYLLKLVGMAVEDPLIGGYGPYRMLAIKFFPIVFDVLTIWLLYHVCAKRSPVTGLLAAGVWAVNPSAIYNCAAWGQTDTIMMFQLLLAFWAFYEEKPMKGTILFALAALTKMQCLYFAPVILYFFLRKRDFSGLVKALGAGLLSVLIVFLPFMIGSRDPLLIFNVYFDGFGKYPYINLNAFNLYGLSRNNWVPDAKSIFGGIVGLNGLTTGGFTFSMLSTLFLLATIVFTCWLALRGKRFSVFLNGALLMECLFMLTTRQHERYQVVVMIFLLAAFLTERDFRLFGVFTGVVFTTFCNQVLLLNHNINQSAPWLAAFHELQAVGSAINLLLFGWLVFLCVEDALGPFRRPFGRKKGPAAAEGR